MQSTPDGPENQRQEEKEGQKSRRRRKSSKEEEEEEKSETVGAKLSQVVLFLSLFLTHWIRGKSLDKSLLSIQMDTMAHS